MTFTITSLQVEQDVHEYEGWVIDPEWSWAAPDGRVVKWNGSQGRMENAVEAEEFEGINEDGDDIMDHFWRVEGTYVRVPEPPCVRKMMKIAGVPSIHGTFSDSTGKTLGPCVTEKFDAEYQGAKVLGILITAASYREGGPTIGQFVADKVIPCAT